MNFALLTEYLADDRNVLHRNVRRESKILLPKKYGRFWKMDEKLINLEDFIRDKVEMQRQNVFLIAFTCAFNCLLLISINCLLFNFFN